MPLNSYLCMQNNITLYMYLIEGYIEKDISYYNFTDNINLKYYKKRMKILIKLTATFLKYFIPPISVFNMSLFFRCSRNNHYYFILFSFLIYSLSDIILNTTQSIIRFFTSTNRYQDTLLFSYYKRQYNWSYLNKFQNYYN